MSTWPTLSDRRPPLLMGLISLSVTACIAWVGGFRLNLLALSVIAVAMTLPAFAVNVRRNADGGALLLACATGVIAIWFGANRPGLRESGHLWLCTAMLGVLAWGEISLCRLFVACGVDRTVCSAGVTVIVLAWLLWPLWTTVAPPLCVRLHPLLAINGVVAADLGIWTEQPIAYPWIALGQDVSYRLPSSVWPAVVMHATIACLAMLLRRLLETIQRGWAGHHGDGVEPVPDC